MRFSGCTLTCDYCDTPESRVRTRECLVVGAHGGAPNIIPNPVSPERLTEIVNSFQTHPNLHHSISLTGGEPLEQVDFLKVWLPMIRRGMEIPHPPPLIKGGKRGDLKIYLETNGLLPAHLSKVISLVDIIGMDIKLPSVAKTKPDWNLQRDFLRIASKKEVFVKVVVSKKVADSDIEQAIDIVGPINPDIPFIFQPKTPLDMDAGELLRLQETASRKLSQVRVIPQVHKLLNLK